MARGSKEGQGAASPRIKAPAVNPWLRHVLACNNVALPAGRLRLVIAGEPTGWVLPAMAKRLLSAGLTAIEGGVLIAHPDDLQPIARSLADAGAFRWRDEAFDVRDVAGRVITTLDRGAFPAFGLAATGVHMNGLVRQGERLSIWVACRAADKALDPGKLDHVAAGGVPAGLGADETMAKEAQEEAAIPPALTARARRHAAIRYVMARPEGLRRDTLIPYDLELDEVFQPRPNDGEVAGFELWPAPQVLEALRDGDAFKFNVPLVLLGLMLRERLIDPDGADGRALAQALADPDQSLQPRT